jgi:hypothetical protein
MKRYILLVLAFVLVLLSACHAVEDGSTPSMESTVPTTAPASMPTEPAPMVLQIIAPDNSLKDYHVADYVADMQIQEGYCLLKNRSPQGYDYYDPNTLNNYGWSLQMLPELLEERLADMSIHYAARTNYGGFFTGITLKDDYYVGSQGTFLKAIQWTGPELPPDTAPDQEKPDRVWLDLVVYAEDSVVGMIVFELVPYNGKEHTFTAAYRYSEYYPQVDSQFQEISEESAWQRIDAYHSFAENTPGWA